ncbi:unnamed protein product, partial [Mesocestoides corti]
FKKNFNYAKNYDLVFFSDVRPPSHKDPTVLRVVTDHPIPLCCSLYYYEVNVCAKSQCGNTGRISLYNRSNTSSDDEDSLCGPTFGEGDVIGCGLNFVSNSVFFTRNGIIVCSSSVRQKLVSSIAYLIIISVFEVYLRQMYPCVNFNFSSHHHRIFSYCLPTLKVSDKNVVLVPYSYHAEHVTRARRPLKVTEALVLPHEHFTHSPKPSALASTVLQSDPYLVLTVAFARSCQRLNRFC